MKRILIYLFVGLGLTGYGQSSNTHFSLEGKTHGIDDGTYLYFRDLINGSNIDSTLINDNRFIFKTKLPEPVYYVMLFTEDMSNFVPLWLEDNPMTFDASNGDFMDAIVTGSDNHALNTRLDSEIYYDVRVVEDHVLKQREVDFILQHLDAVVSADVLYDNSRLTQDELREYYALLTPDVQASSIGQRIARDLAKDQPQIGDYFVDFTAFNPNGEPEKISSHTGKLTLLHFWSSKCHPSRMMNSDLSELYKEYHLREFKIISISGDQNKEQWIQAIEEDELQWPQISQLKGWRGDGFETYGVHSTPSNFLINDNGVIIGRNLKGEKLKQQVREYLKVE